MQTALVTGASKGLGVDFARMLAGRGYRVVLAARSVERLEQVRKALPNADQHKVVESDLSKPGAAQELYAASGEVEVLINNAGFGRVEGFVSQDMRLIDEMMMLNMHALTMLARLATPGMKARGKGYVLNVASTAAFLPMPYFGVYAATKAYVLSVSQALHEELAPFGVRVTALCPGPTKTEFFAGNDIHASSFGMNLQGSEEVARIGLDAMFGGKAVVVAGARNRATAVVSRNLPQRLVRKIVARSLRKHARV